MNQLPIPEDWRTEWRLAGQLDQLMVDEAVDVTVGGIVLKIRNSDSGLTARSTDRAYPVMVVDDEVFVLLGDAPD